MSAVAYVLRFVTKDACDGQTDRRTDRRTIGTNRITMPKTALA